ncbi:MAG: nucleotidyltransferase domain-containing protein [Candidatus Omnitrophica bacterium]|nr:nucleotidyltransferase domain-containing protein [Candidatus Omnitrophota bacterium]
MRQVFIHIKKKKVLLNLLKNEIKKFYKENLVSLVIFGSFARSDFFSDIDLLIVCKRLPVHRIRRVEDFMRIEDILIRKGFDFFYSPVIKTTEEVKLGSPLFFDMIEDAIILYDRDNFFKNYLNILKKRLNQLGATKMKYKDYWFWLLKKDYHLGEIFSL